MKTGNHDSASRKALAIRKPLANVAAADASDAPLATTMVEVLLPLPFAQGFDYRVEEDIGPLRAGEYVLVPFGQKTLVGVVWGPARGDVATEKCKSVLAVLRAVPAMSAIQRHFIEWVAWYTLSPRGAVLKMAIPAPGALQPKARKRVSKKTTPVISTTDAGANANSDSAAYHYAPTTLSDAQQQAVDQLRTTLAPAAFNATLIDGVTGSGKTEVYFAAMADVLARGGQVLVLLPEIALSVQWLARFEARFGAPPSVWHSALTPARREATWRAIASGAAQVIVGARSALFLPYANLSLIIVDEEHEASYKQEDGVHYHARDMAVARAHQEHVPVWLVSATPSLETRQNVEEGRYQLVHLPERHGEAELPRIEVIDMRGAQLPRNRFISERLANALKTTLTAGHQAMLFLNRRGYAPLVLCRACGHRFQCAQCSAWMVLHQRRPRLQCHHCGHTDPLPTACPACGEKERLEPFGPGVERLVEEARALLPDARIEVMTSDVAAQPKMLTALVEGMTNGTIDLLVGTQMMAKGHHFPGLALVGVVDADLGLSGGDLRAAERTYQLLHQLSGRAGRAQVAGTVMLQSYQPTHPVMQALISGERDAFLREEAACRAEAEWPPFGRLAALIIDGPGDAATAEFARALVAAAPQDAAFHLLGPAPAPIHMLRGRYRYRILVKASRKAPMQHYLLDWLQAAPTDRHCRVRVDVDPYSFL